MIRKRIFKNTFANSIGKILSFAFQMAIVSYLIGLYFKKILGGITGDVIGAVSEVNEVMFILIIISALH